MAQWAKKLPIVQETPESWVRFLDWEDPLEDDMAVATPVFLPGESHGQRSLVGGLQSIGHKELDTSEVTDCSILLLNVKKSSIK